MSEQGFCYVGTLPCGCGVSIVADRPEWRETTAKDVANMITGGLNVTRLDTATAKAVFLFECENYPHEEWQKRQCQSSHQSDLFSQDTGAQPT